MEIIIFDQCAVTNNKKLKFESTPKSIILDFNGLIWKFFTNRIEILPTHKHFWFFLSLLKSKMWFKKTSGTHFINIFMMSFTCKCSNKKTQVQLGSTCCCHTIIITTMCFSSTFNSLRKKSQKSGYEKQQIHFFTSEGKK